MDDATGYVEPKKRKYNRRSSFFQRGSVSQYSGSPRSPPDLLSDVLDQDPLEVTSSVGDPKTKYLNQLRFEQNQWTKLMKEKKKELGELRSKSVLAATSMEFLTEEDKQFLEDRPDYMAVGRLLDDVAEAVAIKERRISCTEEKITNLIQSFEKRCQEEAEYVIDYFLEEFGEFKKRGKKQVGGDSVKKEL